MKIVEFYGKTYQVPDDALYIAYDYYGDVKVSNRSMKRRTRYWADWGIRCYFKSEQWIVQIDDREDLDKSLWHGSLTKI